MFKPYDYAFQIEVTVRAIFNCKKYELGGIADANFIKDILVSKRLKIFKHR